MTAGLMKWSFFFKVMFALGVCWFYEFYIIKGEMFRDYGQTHMQNMLIFKMYCTRINLNIFNLIFSFLSNIS